MGGLLQRALTQLETFTVAVIYNRRHDWKARVWGGFLRSLSWLFRGIVKSRAFLYRKRLMHSHHLGCLVIVVGNLTVGGTGKTPVVERIARTLHQGGRKVAILSRGYKSKKEPLLKKSLRLLLHREEAPPRIVSDGQSVLLDSGVAGDEPYMLARNLPGVVVLTDKDRVKAGRYAIQRFGCDTLILDDGYQYFKLKDHLQLLLIDKSDPFGNGCVLPRGILREPISHLKRASYIFLTKSDGQPDAELEGLIRRYRPDIDLIECRHRPRHLAPVQAPATPQPEPQKPLPLETLEGKRVAALSAIATPETFEAFLSELGAEVVQSHRFLDHHRYDVAELQRIFAAAAAAGLDALVTTEKDAVRIPAEPVAPVPFLYLRVDIQILSGARDFAEAVLRMCTPRQVYRAAPPSRSVLG